jgi:hypothetical protein
MKATATELMIGSLIARRIADCAYRAICEPGTRRVRGRSDRHRAYAVTLAERGDTLAACRARRGLDPFRALSDSSSDYYRQTAEALLYIRQLRNEARRLKVAAFALARSPTELITAPLMVDHQQCIATAQQALDAIGHGATVHS